MLSKRNKKIKETRVPSEWAGSFLEIRNIND